MGAGEDSAQLGHLIVRHEAARHGLRLGLRLARAVGAEHVEVDARAQVRGVHDRLVARRHARDDVAGERVLACAGLPAKLAGKLARIAWAVLRSGESYTAKALRPMPA